MVPVQSPGFWMASTCMGRAGCRLAVMGIPSLITDRHRGRQSGSSSKRGLALQVNTKRPPADCQPAHRPFPSSPSAPHLFDLPAVGFENCLGMFGYVVSHHDGHHVTEGGGQVGRHWSPRLRQSPASAAEPRGGRQFVATRRRPPTSPPTHRVVLVSRSDWPSTRTPRRKSSPYKSVVYASRRGGASPPSALAWTHPLEVENNSKIATQLVARIAAQEARRCAAPIGPGTAVRPDGNHAAP